MTQPTPAQVAVSDPLGPVTRKERRALLAVSLLGIVLVKTGLVPSRISALGIEFTSADQRSLLLIVALVIGYFLAAFIIYAVSDFIAWRVAYAKAVTERFTIRPDTGVVDQEAQRIINQHLKRERMVYISAPAVAVVRAVFEFIVPVALAVYALVVVLCGAK